MKKSNYTPVWPKKRVSCLGMALLMVCARRKRCDVGWWVGGGTTQAWRGGLVGWSVSESATQVWQCALAC
ncbi:MAG: hypothetical protein ACPGWR_26175 [Ardenticatenaceae bacterium]